MVREANAEAARPPAARCPSLRPPATSLRQPPLRLLLPPPLLRLWHLLPPKCPGQDLLALLLIHHSRQQPRGSRRLCRSRSSRRLPLGQAAAQLMRAAATWAVHWQVSSWRMPLACPARWHLPAGLCSILSWQQGGRPPQLALPSPALDQHSA